MNVQEFSMRFQRIRTEAARALIGQEEVIDLTLIAVFARGHVLLEGVPGLGKTLLVRTFGHVLGCQFKRIQFTPDLMPSDVTGGNVFNQGKDAFEFFAGPVFTQLLLADEINRAPAKTQAALLEAMQERSVTTDGVTRMLPAPFLVIATQNPIESQGTYPLPEAQLDRFMFQIDVGYPDEADEIEIVKRSTSALKPTLAKVLSPERIMALQDLVLRVPVAEHVVRYAVALARASRPPGKSAADQGPGGGAGKSLDFVREHVAYGAGPRASQFLILGAKARAILDGRFAASVEDVRALAMPTLQHRLILNFHAESQGIKAPAVVERLLAAIKS